MAFDFHQDTDRYFDMQRENAAHYVIPFIEEKRPIRATDRVLEIGCAEGGVLKAFLDRGCTGVGIELLPQRLESARQYLHKELGTGQVQLMAGDIYDVDPQHVFDDLFDIIVLKDVIEHIPDQQRLLYELQGFLNRGGVIFLGFPPWQMPFGGHQQICRHRWLSKFPYMHLLPAGWYRSLLKAAGEPDHVVKELMEIKDTGLSIGQLEEIAQRADYKLVHRQLYLINPIYQYKFNLSARTQLPFVGSLPYIRNFVTTCAYYLLARVEKKS